MFDLKLTAASVKTNITIRLTLNGEIFAEFNYPTATLVEGPDIYHFPYNPPVDVRVGDNLLVNTFSSDGPMEFLGRADTQVKWQRVNLILWDFEQLPTMSDIPNISEKFVKLNNQSTATGMQSSGIVVNHEPTTTTDTASNFIGSIGSSSGSSGQCTTTGSGTFNQNDLIQVSGTRYNDGIYEVHSHTGNTLEIRGVGGTSNVEDFTRQDFEYEVDSGSITKTNVSVIKTGANGRWFYGYGDETTLTFTRFLLEGDIERLKAAEDDIPETVKSVLENDITVTEETTPTLTASNFNTGLGTGGTQKIFVETSPNTPIGGNLSSEPISATRNKLIYIGRDHQYADADLLVAYDGVSSNTTLAVFQQNQILANQRVAATSASTVTDTIYPAPSNLVSGATIWQTIPTLTFVNGIPVPEADELFFTRNIPTSATTLTIQYRGHANGNIFGSATTTLAGVGGNVEVATSVNISDGSETANLEIRYYPSTRQIRASVTERVSQGLPTINDVQVILSWQETRTIPATPATTRLVVISDAVTNGQSNVIAMKASATNTVILVGDTREVDTGRPFTNIFGAAEAGNLVVHSDEAVYYNYTNIEPTDPLIVSLENQSSQPNFGLFDTNYTHDTVVTLDTQLQAHNSEGDVVNLGEELILVAPNNTRWRLSVDNSGNLSTTQVT